MSESDFYAQRLHEMVGDGVDAVPAAGEARSLENPNTPITPSQLADVLSYGPTRAGVSVNEHTALTFTAVFAAIRILADSVGMLPLVTYQGDEDDNRRKRAPAHPVYRLLRREPNPEMTAAVFKETLQAHLAGWGNAYARIETDMADRPRRLWPLLPDRTTPERVAGQLRYRVEGGSGGNFAPEEVLHIPGLGFNGIKGYSPIGYAREAIATGKAAEIFGATFFGNGAHMGGVLSHPLKLKNEAKANLRESVLAMHQGSANSHKLLLLDEGMKYDRMGIPPDEAQFLETRKFQVIEIARIFRIPPHMLADLDRATFSNIEHQSLEFLIHTLSPWLDKWEQEINRKLFRPGEGYYVQFDERRLMRGDLAARKDYYATARQWGWMSANDVLAEEGKNPIGERGDVYLSPMNMVPPEMIGKEKPGAPAAKPAPTTMPPTSPPQSRTDDDQRFAGALRGVFEDAVGRMLRKESNALARAGADRPEKVERFYTEHRTHVFDSLLPACMSLAAAMELDEAQARAAVTPRLWAIAGERHGAGVDVDALAPARAQTIIDDVLQAMRGQTL